MRQATIVMLAVLVGCCLPSAARADSMATFGNNDGTFSSTSNTTPLSLGGSFLTQISGLAPLIADQSAVFNTATNNCVPAGCLGTVSLTTGALTSGTLINLSGNPSAGVNAHFGGSGSSFTVSGSGFVFHGTFSGAAWTCTGKCNGADSTGQWVFNGQLASGTLQVGTTSYLVAGGGVIQLTTIGAPIVTRVGGVITKITWKDNSGTAAFPSPVPEPGTLSLLGGGLIGIAAFARRRAWGKPVET